ncbi:type IV pili methyl-accepting chemotaxis transducer N-terminal domain-containing protein [Agarivorans sp. MS3-6]|uniref:type IV pili methyl-accepting chemotaxis transducer N-terminal domain-containing protein n=1 Tax=Agarivorans sp. TSD2052 TaxID=2937286 RepID=UPI00200E527B|nr:type IV pili methyl-accepting chemotaxis transducer N-terminal domain-containing protein [Agarivorans sp. TSD2052]UPW20406.1 type IV pili methyl-accepting chemotaxis transducer N-terminal domain-containing protein [Agarivorans sp. TSD2052]
MKRFFGKRSIGIAIIRLLSLMMFLFALVAVSSLTTLVNSLKDAEAINVAGSLRMQSYRMAHALNIGATDIKPKISQFENSLNSPSLKKVAKQDDTILQHYQAVQDRWKQLKPVVSSRDVAAFDLEIVAFVDLIDDFVAQTQYSSEQKVFSLTLLQLIAFAIITIIAIYTLWYMRRNISKPIYKLVEAAKQVQNGDFKLDLATRYDSIEMETLSKAIISMSKDLERSYQNLENQVKDKTKELRHANRDLNFLYQLEQELFNSDLNQQHLERSLKLLCETLAVSDAKLYLEKLDISIEIGETNESLVSPRELRLENEHYGYLQLPAIAHSQQAIVNSYSRTVTKVLRFEQSLLQKQKLLLMEERATIARELHDSLAQTLSYLKIQTSLLQRQLKNHPADVEQSWIISEEIKNVLGAAYAQLRELLSTFRLTIKNALLTESLKVLVKELNNQHPQTIVLSSDLSNDMVEADKQIHIIQIVREAIINALKHADCDTISVTCIGDTEQITLEVSDDGLRGNKLKQVNDHYGLQIMQERAQRLNGQINFDQSLSGGVSVKLSFPLLSKQGTTEL